MQCNGRDVSMNEKLPRSVGTHDGMFHADEVTACALLILFGCVDRDRICRTRDPHLLGTCEYVCDVGGVYEPERKCFDHHQVSYQGPFSSAGMVLSYLKQQQILSDEEYQFFQGSIIRGVDDHDNGRSNQQVGVCTFSHVIANFAPAEYRSSPEELQRLFYEALDFTLGHLRRLHVRFLYNQSCRQVVAQQMDSKESYLVFDEAIPWLESFFALGGKNHPASFVIMPSQNHWKLRGIPPDLEHRMQVRIPMPLPWAGLLGEELQKVTGMPEAVFCHKGRFISVWETKEAALRAMQKILVAETHTKQFRSS